VGTDVEKHSLASIFLYAFFYKNVQFHICTFNKKMYFCKKNLNNIMKKLGIVTLLCIMVTFAAQSQRLNYPETKKTDHVDVYHGIEVADPFRWLEDENSEETKRWVEAQNEVTFKHLESIPFRKQVRSRLEDLWNFERRSVPGIYEGKLIFSHNTGMQNQSVIYIKDGARSEPRVLLDPNTLSKDGTTSIAGTSVCNNNRYLAYQISKGGSDWNEVFVIDMETGKTLEDHLKWLKFSPITWFKDGFFYSRYEPEDETRALSGKNEYHSVYYHKLNTPQSEDLLIFRNENEPLRTYRTRTDNEEQWLFLTESQSTSNNALYVKNLSNTDSEFELITNQDFAYTYSFVGMVNEKFLMYTNEDASLYKLMLADPNNPHRDNWEDFIPEQEWVMQNVLITKSNIVIQAMDKAFNKLLVYDFSGNFKYEIELPDIGTLAGLSGRSYQDTIYFGFMSYTQPNSVYEFDLTNKKRTPFFEPRMKFNFNEYETKQVFYPSKDGTSIPMFITMKKGTKLDGNNPVLLYGYGGFNVSLTPRFSVSIIPFMEQGGIYAVANIRGGGEFGKEWHQAGTKLQKQNVFDDFIAAAEYLIANKYTNPKRIGIQGGSNGGLLVGACMIQRPDLFQVALPAVGVMDMLRFHKFTIGWAWVGDYGSSDDPEEFEYLLNYSPVHTLKKGVAYPATLVTTADHDDRVVPAHSFKFIAALQKNHDGDLPVLIRIDTQAGHGAGKPVSKIIDEAADVQSFLMYHLGMKVSY
jgi:prolyl oligopeptidase